MYLETEDGVVPLYHVHMIELALICETINIGQNFVEIVIGMCNHLGLSLV
jgi:hypothetical protein